MFLPEPNVNIWLYTQPMDMRKFFGGLNTLVSNQLQKDPLSGQLFVFVNRHKPHIKVLYFDGAKFCIWFKRLEQGQFNVRESSGKQVLDWMRLKLLLDDLEIKQFRQYKRYSHAT